MKKPLAVMLSAAMTLSMAGCQGNNEKSENSAESKVSTAEEKAINYNMYDYENDEIFYVDKIKLSDEFSSVCTTYEFSFLSDGYQIKAYIAIPNESIESNTPCKCILYNRGGHYNYGSLDYNYITAISAYSKRIAIGCEIRGGNGSEGYDQFGGDEIHDVIKLIDFCENNFSFVDMDDFCVMGVSRGGMTAYMTARQDKRVKKLIIGSGVSDLVELYEEREEEMKQVLRDCIGGSPKEKILEYAERSAICWADEINIPVLIIHSKGDTRVPFSQAESMYKQLQKHTDCTLITHDDDLHDFHEEDIPKMLEWLNK